MKSFSEVKEGTFFLFASFHSLLDEFYQYAIVTQPAALRHGAHLLCDFARERHTSPHMPGWNLFRCGHSISIHQFGAPDTLLNLLRHHVGLAVAAVPVAQNPVSLVVADHRLFFRIEVKGAAQAVGSVGQVQQGA